MQPGLESDLLDEWIGYNWLRGTVSKIKLIDACKTFINYEFAECPSADMYTFFLFLIKS